MRYFCVLFLIFAPLYCEEEAESQKFETLYKSPIYRAVGLLFESVSHAAAFGGGVCSLLGEKAITPNECLLFSNICFQAAQVAFKGIDGKKSHWRQTAFKNQTLLTQVPVSSEEDLDLLDFLENRWLAKVAGISRLGLDWIYPCFGLSLQANPLSNHSYARLASSYMADSYKKRMESWKESFSKNTPLILTRPSNVGPLLPSYFSLTLNDSLEEFVEKLRGKAVVDLTEFLSLDPTKREFWQKRFSDLCTLKNLDINDITCIERVEAKGIGGIRILPLFGHSLKTVSSQYTHLLDWTATMGLVATRVELDRGHSIKKRVFSEDLFEETLEVEGFLQFIKAAKSKCEGQPHHQKILIDGTLHAIEGLFASLGEEGLEKLLSSKTKTKVAKLSIENIEKQLTSLLDNLNLSTFELGSSLEIVHANLSALLEVMTPFSKADFSNIYQDLNPLPESLNSLTSFGIHSTGMTCLGSIIKAVEKNLGDVHAIYGEFTYYECVKAFQKLSKVAVRSDQAREENWKEANLLFYQSKPALRIDLDFEQYEAEKIIEAVKRCLSYKREAPLTLILDSTLDFIVSNKVKDIIANFSEEIKEGVLNVVVFRSGNKLDLLGMDNYCGAPFFFLNNNDFSFDFLMTDPSLQCDRLSLNWFCLAYKYVFTELELYKKQIYENTRNLLDRVPEAMTKNKARYRLVPMTKEGEAPFLDIKVTGPFQKGKSVALVLPLFFLESMKAKEPLFNRPSLGFYHPNITVIFGEECSTIRLTLGLDPLEVDLFVRCFETLSRI